MSRLRLADIAEMANVSTSTVSKVPNGHSDVGPATRAKVEKILTDCGYQKSLLNPTSSKQIEIVFEDFEEQWAMELLQGAVRTLEKRGISVTITELRKREKADSSWIQDILERRPIGVILVFSDLTDKDKDQFASRKIPYITVDPAGDPAPNSITIRADNWTGELIATRHLIALGHQRIGIITGPIRQLCAKARLDGFLTALDEANIKRDTNLIRHDRFTVEGGFQQAVSLLSLDNPPTAILAGNDLQALGIYDAARRHHLSIPDDLSVIGLGDVMFSRYLSPALTTVQQPLNAMAGRAAEMLLTLSNNESVPQSTVFPTNLVVRNSTAPPPNK